LPPDRLFVANTEQSLIAVVRIGTDGSAGTPQALTAPFTLLALDGITVDAQGNLYVVLPAFEIVGSAPIVRLNPDTGEIVPLVLDAVDQAKFDDPLSVTFGRGIWGATSIFVTNGDLGFVLGGPGPGVVRVAIGTPGFP
jgi:sugar lactone lactonase YvrE